MALARPCVDESAGPSKVSIPIKQRAIVLGQPDSPSVTAWTETWGKPVLMAFYRASLNVSALSAWWVA